jgi:hypothetical protein
VLFFHSSVLWSLFSSPILHYSELMAQLALCRVAELSALGLDDLHQDKHKSLQVQPIS